MKISKNLYSYLKLHEYELNNREFDRLFSYAERYMNPTDSGCFYKLVRKSIPNYLYYMSFIPSGFFEDDQSITNIVLPENIQWVGYAAFRSCRELQSVTLPSSIKYIPDNCFQYCDKLKEVKGTENIENLDIGKSAFEYCKNLQEIILPKSFNNLYNDSFKGCNNLTIIYEGDPSYWHKIFDDLLLYTPVKVKFFK